MALSPVLLSGFDSGESRERTGEGLANCRALVGQLEFAPIPAKCCALGVNVDVILHDEGKPSEVSMRMKKTELRPRTQHARSELSDRHCEDLGMTVVDGRWMPDCDMGCCVGRRRGLWMEPCDVCFMGCALLPEAQTSTQT